MSEFFKAKETRIAIFQDWNISAPTLKLPKSDFQEKNKPEQIRRAQELLNDAQLLQHNILSFLRLKNNLTSQIVAHQRTAEKLLEEMYELNSNRTQDLRQEDNMLLRIRQILQESYRLLRGGRMLEQTIASYFQKANLANYNPQVHQLKYGKSSEETAIILQEKLDQIRRGCRNLFRSMHFSEKLPVVFTKEESFEYAYSSLFELLSHDSLVRIHAHMICQLKGVEDLKQGLVATNRSIQSQYLKYQLVYDCLQLMKSECQEISRAKQKLQDNYMRGVVYVPLANDNYPAKSRLAQEEESMRDAVLEGKELQNEVQAHMKVYRTNLSNFTRVSAETSLYCYAYRYSNFAEALNNLELYFAQWRANYTALEYLYDQRSTLQSIKQQQGIRQSFTEHDRQTLSRNYEETRVKKLPNEERLEGYRRSLLADFERELQRHRIGFSQRQIRRQDVKSILARQNDFFQRLKAVDTREKISYLRRNSEHIQKLIFEIEQLQLHSDQQEPLRSSLHLYSSALSFARIIASTASYQAKLEGLQELHRAGMTYRQLPHGMTEVVLAYIHDVKIMIGSDPDVHIVGRNHMQQFLDSVQTKIRDKKRMKIDEAVETNVYRLSDSWLKLHANYYRFLTPQGEELMLEQLRDIGVTIGTRIHDVLRGVAEIPELEVKAMQIDRSFFYSYRVLLALVSMVQQQRNREALQKFRIVNLPSVLESTFQYFDNKFADLPANNKASDIIKLSLMEMFLEKVYPDAQYAHLISTLRLQTYLQYTSELYQQNFENEATKNIWLHPLLQIHFRINSIPSRLLSLHDKAISQQMTSLLHSIKRYPLTLSTKRDVSALVSTLRIRDLTRNLQQIIQRGQYSIGEAAEASVALREFQVSFGAVETPFEGYENVMMRTRKEASFFLQELRKRAERQLQQVGERESLERHFLDSKSSITLQQGISRLLPRSR